jgi:hypothetical protein
LSGTFAINKIELERILTSFKVSDKNIESILAQLDRMHKHVNVIMFTGMLQNVGLKHNDIINMLRRAGIDDVTISNIFDVLEEEKIKNTFGKLIELKIE